MTMATQLGYEYYEFCGGEKCLKIIDLAKKMIERYKGDKTNLYKEMEDMEKEFKDKEEYIDHLRKKRSDLEKEVRFLKDKVERKNEDLVKADNDVMEAKFKVVEQEEISKRKITKLKEESKVFTKQVEISNKVIAALKGEVKNLKDILESKNKLNVENVDALEVKINALRDSLEKEKSKQTVQNEDKEIQTIAINDEKEKFELENECLKRKVEDLGEEIFEKNSRIEKLENRLASKSLENSQNSLKDELEKASVATCEKCGKLFKTEKDLKDHMKNEHDKSAARISFQNKLKKLEIDLSKQRMHLTSSLLKLKEKEILNKDCCSCVGFCHINHRKHNFSKSTVEDIFDKLKNTMKDEDVVEIKETKKKENKFESGAKKKSYKCKSCKLIFKKMAVLKKHEKQHEQNQVKDSETRPKQTSSFQCKIRGKRSKSKKGIKTLTKNQHESESIKQIKDVNELDPVSSQCQSENEFDDSYIDGSDYDEKEEYTDDTVTSEDDVSISSSSQPVSFEEDQENSGEEEV